MSSVVEWYVTVGAELIRGFVFVKHLVFVSYNCIFFLFIGDRIAAMGLVWEYGEKSGHTAWKGLTWGMVSHIHITNLNKLSEISMQILGEMVSLPLNFILNMTAILHIL